MTTNASRVLPALRAPKAVSPAPATQGIHSPMPPARPALLVHTSPQRATQTVPTADPEPIQIRRQLPHPTAACHALQTPRPRPEAPTSICACVSRATGARTEARAWRVWRGSTRRRMGAMRARIARPASTCRLLAPPRTPARAAAPITTPRPTAARACRAPPTRCRRGGAQRWRTANVI